MSFKSVLFVLCSVLTISLTYSAFGDQESGNYYEGQLVLTSISVIKNGERSTYAVTPEGQRNFLLSPQRSLQIGRLNRCPINLGQIESEFQVDVNVTAQYRDGGYDKDFNMIKVPTGQGGLAKVVVPAGTRLWGLCRGKSAVNNTLTNFAFEPEQDKRSKIYIKFE